MPIDKLSKEQLETINLNPPAIFEPFINSPIFIIKKYKNKRLYAMLGDMITLGRRTLKSYAIGVYQIDGTKKNDNNLYIGKLEIEENIFNDHYHSDGIINRKRMTEILENYEKKLKNFKFI